VIKLLVGLLKGAVIGGAVGYGAYAAKLDLPWITYGVIGTLVGLVAGRPIWSLIKDKNTTFVVGVLKAAFGFGVGCGLYALLAKAWGPAPGLLVVSGQDLLNWSVTVGGAIGAVYGAFVELDDGISDDKGDSKDKSQPVAKPKQLKK
jgi:hypothetical protein